MTERGVHGRLALYVGIAVIAFLLGDDTFRSAVRPLVITSLGAISVGLITIRAYIDQSISQHQDEQEAEDEAAEAQEKEQGLGQVKLLPAMTKQREVRSAPITNEESD